MKKIRLSKSTIVTIKENFGILTFLTIGLGYIGFYTYAAKYSLPFVIPDISLIIGIGILCILLLVGFYLASGGRLKRTSTMSQSLILLFIILLVENQLNPIFLFLFLYGYIDADFDFFLSNETKNFKKRRESIRKIQKKNKVWRLIIINTFLLIAIFFDYTLLILLLFISSAITVFKRVRYNHFEIHKILLIALLTPIFIFGFLLKDFNFTFFGLSRTPIVITKEDSSTFKGVLIYEDRDFYYFEDSVSKTVNEFASIQKSRAIAKNKIISFRTDSIPFQKVRHKSLIDILRK